MKVSRQWVAGARNTDRSLGGRIAGTIAAKYGDYGFQGRADPIDHFFDL